jgi:HK97 family phage portal protein
MTKEVAESNRKSWQAAYGGQSNSGGTAVLQGGMKYQSLSLSPADAKWLEVMEATTEDVSRIFGVPMHKLSALKRSTNNNIEHQGREFVTDTVRPDANRIEAEFQKLFSDRSDSYFLFNLDSLMRGDTQARAAMYSIMLNTGTLNRDEVRRLEGFNPIASGEGAIHLYPINYAPMSALGRDTNNTTEVVTTENTDGQEPA